MPTRTPASGGLLAAALALFLWAGPLSAQDSTAPADPSPGTTPAQPAPSPQQGPPQQGPPAVPDSVQELVSDFQGLQRQLASLQDQAIQQNEELQEQRDAVEEEIQQAMLENNPELQEDMERMEELQGEMMEAQEAQDQQRMISISRESVSLQRELRTAQARVMDEPDVQEAVESFQEDLLDEMMEIDSEAEEMIAELEALGRRVQAYQASQQSRPSGGPPSGGL